MEHFEAWCKQVLRQVRFWPDCDAIRKELRNHYIDHVKDLERIGYPAEEALPKALAAMGDAKEVGRGLDRAHAPWLGWLWEASRCAVALTLCFMLLFIGTYKLPQVHLWQQPEPYFPLLEGFPTVPCPRDFSSGVYDYEFEHVQYNWNGEYGSMDICLTAVTPRFYLEPPNFSGALEAVDSGGRMYTQGNGKISGTFGDGHYRMACMIRLNFTQELPQWVEVTNTVADWSFRIDIPQEGRGA